MNVDLLYFCLFLVRQYEIIYRNGRNYSKANTIKNVRKTGQKEIEEEGFSQVGTAMRNKIQ